IEDNLFFGRVAVEQFEGFRRRLRRVLHRHGREIRKPAVEPFSGLHLRRRAHRAWIVHIALAGDFFYTPRERSFAGISHRINLPTRAPYRPMRILHQATTSGNFLEYEDALRGLSLSHSRFWLLDPSFLSCTARPAAIRSKSPGPSGPSSRSQGSLCAPPPIPSY